MSTIDWKKIRDTQVPPVAEDDPMLSLLYAQLKAFDRYPPEEGQIPGMQKTWEEARDDLRLQIEEEIARYRFLRSAGFPLQLMRGTDEP